MLNTFRMLNLIEVFSPVTLLFLAILAKYQPGYDFICFFLDSKLKQPLILAKA